MILGIFIGSLDREGDCVPPVMLRGRRPWDERFEMSERGGSKSRKATVSKAPASKAPVTKTAAAKPASAKGAATKNARKTAPPARKGSQSSSAPKASKTPSRQPKQPAETARSLDASSLLARVIRLESERDRLQAELATATSRIQALEESREQVVNRIDWVIDSLRNLVDD
jgi:hypothetical protein